MSKEMTAVEYLKAKARMTKTNEYITCDKDCKNDCMLSLGNNPRDKSCMGFEMLYPEEAVAIVRKWAEEHPRKTRQSEFLEMFPNVGMCDGVIALDPCDLDTGYEPPKGCRSECSDCRQDYWLAELTEEEVEE